MNPVQRNHFIRVAIVLCGSSLLGALVWSCDGGGGADGNGGDGGSDSDNDSDSDTDTDACEELDWGEPADFTAGLPVGNWTYAGYIDLNITNRLLVRKPKISAVKFR